MKKIPFPQLQDMGFQLGVLLGFGLSVWSRPTLVVVLVMAFIFAAILYVPPLFDRFATWFVKHYRKKLEKKL